MNNKKLKVSGFNLTTMKTKVLYGIVALSLGLGSGSALAVQSIVFIGNSFTYGDKAPNVQNYQPGTVTDLNKTGIGGMPALFKAFTVEAGLDYNVSLETAAGQGFKYHWDNKRTLLNQQPWDVVVMHGFSTLSSSAPGNPAEVIDYGNRLAQMFTSSNPNVDVNLMATWSRADQTYPSSGFWYGKPITQMAIDVAAGYAAADRQSNAIDDVIPVGLAWNRAIETGFADSNPYDGIEGGKVNLWGSDSYHGSMYGYYLEALTVFGNVTGLDPRSLGAGEKVARDLGISQAQAAAMQQIAFDQLAASAVPEPSTVAIFGLGIMGLLAARKKSGKNINS